MKEVWGATITKRSKTNLTFKPKKLVVIIPYETKCATLKQPQLLSQTGFSHTLHLWVPILGR